VTFEAKQSDDDLKRDLELTCAECGEVVCDIEPGDDLDVLVSVAQGHACGEVAITFRRTYTAEVTETWTATVPRRLVHAAEHDGQEGDLDQYVCDNGSKDSTAPDTLHASGFFFEWEVSE
jgi:hypothetical protein